LAGDSSSATRPGRRENTGLPHAAAEALAVEAPFGNQIGRPRQHRTRGRTQCFGHAEHNSIGARSNFMHGKAQSRRGIEDTGSIHVDAHSTLVRGVAYLAHCAHGVHRSTRHIMSLLDGHRPVARYKGHRAEVSNDLANREQSPFRIDGADHAAAEPGHHREFVIQQVGARIANHLLSVLREQLDGDRVPHGAGRNEQGRRLAGDFGGALFQAVDGGIFTIHVVAHFGFEHGAPHRRRGLGNGIAAQIDHKFRKLLEDFIGQQDAAVGERRMPSSVSSRPASRKRWIGASNRRHSSGRGVCRGEAQANEERSSDRCAVSLFGPEPDK
jgi:hypothetical protein